MTFEDYLEEAEPIAYELGLRPWEFWRMTPSEFEAFVEGQHRAHEKERYLVAWQTAYLLRAWAGKKGKAITPEKLLGIKKKKSDETPEQFSERLQREFVEGNS